MKRIFSYLFFFIISVFISVSSNAQIDSLKKLLLTETNDTSIINTYYKIGVHFTKISNDSALYYQYIADSLCNIIQSKKVKEYASWTTLKKAQVFKNMGYNSIFKREYDMAADYYQKAIELLMKFNADDPEFNAKKKEILSYCHNELGVVLMYQGNYSRSDSVLKIAHQLFIEENDLEGQELALRNLGLISYYTGDYTKAIERFIDAAKVAEQLGNKKSMASLYNNIGGVHEKQQNNKEAIKYYNESIKLKRELNDQRGIASTLNNIGIIYRKEGEYDKAKEKFAESLEIKKELNDMEGIAITSANLGNVYNSLNEPEEAIKNYKFAMEVFEKIGEKKELASVLHDLARLQLQQKNVQEAIINVSRSLDLAIEAGAKPQIMNAYDVLSQCYNITGNYKKSLEYFQLFANVKDSIFNEKKNATFSELEVKYQTEKKEKEIELLKQEKEINVLQLERRKLTIILLIISVLLVILLFLAIYIQIRSKQKQLLKERQLLEEKEKTKAIIETQEKERERIARDLHDGIGQLLSAASLYFGQLSNEIKAEIPGKQENFDHSVKILNDACSELRTISHQMMPRVLTRNGIIAAIEELLSFTFSKTSMKYTFDTFGLKDRIESNKEIGLYRICQELLNNIIKHADASEVSVQLFKNKNMIILLVEDNGKGIDLDKDVKGIGLKNITSRTDAMNGSFEIEKGPTNGTVCTVRIPA